MPGDGERGSLGEIMQLMGARMSFSRNAEIYGESEPADYLYKVVSGTVRTYKVLTDGRRQIGGFYVAGDIFGLESGEEHTFSAEAITECKVLVIKRSALMALAARDHEVSRQLWTITGGELRRVQDHIMLLIKSAQQRVASFLLEMSERISADNAVELPMSRQDIADYLGAHHRDRLPHADDPGERRHHRAVVLAPHRAAQSRALSRLNG